MRAEWDGGRWRCSSGLSAARKRSEARSWCPEWPGGHWEGTGCGLGFSGNGIVLRVGNCMDGALPGAATRRFERPLSPLLHLPHKSCTYDEFEVDRGGVGRGTGVCGTPRGRPDVDEWGSELAPFLDSYMQQLGD